MSSNNATFQEWVGYVKPEIREADDFTILRAIRDACAEFCQRTLFWTEELDAIDIEAAIHTYTPEHPLRAIIAEILVLEALNGSVAYELIGKREEDLDKLYAGSSWRTATELQPRYYYRPNSSSNIRLVATPSTDIVGGLLLTKIALKPGRSTTEVPSFLYDEYREAIGMGAVARMLQMINQPWSDPKGWAQRYQLFLAAIADASRRADQSGILQTAEIQPILMGGYQGEG